MASRIVATSARCIGGRSDRHSPYPSTPSRVVTRARVRQNESPPGLGMRSAMGSMRSMIMGGQFDSAEGRCQRFRRGKGEYRMAVDRFTASDGISLAYYIDDFTDPWRKPDTLLLLHAAVG